MLIHVSFRGPVFSVKWNETVLNVKRSFFYIQWICFSNKHKNKSEQMENHSFCSWNPSWIICIFRSEYFRVNSILISYVHTLLPSMMISSSENYLEDQSVLKLKGFHLITELGSWIYLYPARLNKYIEFVVKIYLIWEL